MSENEQREIVSLLVETSTAHNEFEQRELGGVFDQEWSDWYATYLVEHRIGKLLGAAITQEELARLLTQFDSDYRTQARQETWPDYYAVQLLEWREVAHKQATS